jgi:hypothetical protein
VKPVPETVEALRALHLADDEGAEMAELERLSRRVEALVPTCTGMSIVQSATGLTFTFVAPGAAIQAADPLDYLVRARHGDRPAAPPAHVADPPGDADPTDEEIWRRIAAVDAPAGVSSTLSLPLVEDGEVLGTVTLYGERADTFSGKTEEVADVVGAWAPGATTNDDLWFSSRLRAAAAPTLVAEQAAVDAAVGLVSVRLDVPLAEARRRLREASNRAGISEALMARLLIGERRGA